MLDFYKKEIHQGGYTNSDHKMKDTSYVHNLFHKNYENLFQINNNNFYEIIDQFNAPQENKYFDIFPFSITIIEIKNFSSILRIFGKELVEKLTNLLNDCIYRSINIDSDSIYFSHDGSYIIVSFKKSMNLVVKMADDFLKKTSGLTIPYPKTHVYSDISVNIGIAYFTELNSNINSEIIFNTALEALEKSKLTNKTEIISGFMIWNRIQEKNGSEF